ncbi:hypothetical protein KI387_025640, partial [Taxus chinensis]
WEMAYCNWKVMGILVICLAMCLHITMASLQFRVGGPRGWFEPSGSETETYNQWAERNRFQVNDTLSFKYKAGQDSVLWVKKEAYDSCDTSKPIASYEDGNTVFKLTNSGAFFFISGFPGHCAHGQKVIVAVLGPPPAHSSFPPSPSQNIMNDTSAAVN